MRPIATAAFCAALALVTFFRFPGHTWLQQDTQIYAPILENLHDPTVLRNDILVQKPHVTFTLYDEVSRALRVVTGAGFREVLGAQQVVTRAFGIWGLLLMAASLGLGAAGSMTVAAICSLGAMIVGPQVLTFEFEPTPRAFAVPLIFCAMGLTANRRYLGAGVAAAAAFLYHPPTALPFWAVYFVLALWPGNARRERVLGLVPMAASIPILALAAAAQAPSGEAQNLFARIDSAQEFLQRVRTAYVWVSSWGAATVMRHVIVLAIAGSAFWRLRKSVPFELRVVLGGLALLGIVSMPVSWVLLERVKWSLIPQFQPMRTLLFLTIAMQVLTAAAGMKAGRFAERCAWMAAAYFVSLENVWVAVGLAIVTAAVGERFAPAAALAAFLVMPVSYPALHTAELSELAGWARGNTPRDAVFLFPDVNKGLAPGIFRTEALRAVYVDWKAGGQVNYLKELGDQWWFRWEGTRNFQASDLPRYGAMGISYVVLTKPIEMGAAYQNRGYFVYRIR